MKENVLYDIENSEAPKSRNSKGMKAQDMSREFTKEVFTYEQELRKQAFKALERTKPDMVKEEFIIQNEIATDRMYAKFKVERDTYNQAIVLHKLTQDKGVQDLIHATDKTISPAIKALLMPPLFE